MRWRPVSAVPDPAEGAYSAPQNLLAAAKRPLKSMDLRGPFATKKGKGRDVKELGREKGRGTLYFAKFRPNLFSFRGDIHENVFQTHYTISASSTTKLRQCAARMSTCVNARSHSFDASRHLPQLSLFVFTQLSSKPQTPKLNILA